MLANIVIAIIIVTERDLENLGGMATEFWDHDPSYQHATVRLPMRGVQVVHARDA